MTRTRSAGWRAAGWRALPGLALALALGTACARRAEPDADGGTAQPASAPTAQALSALCERWREALVLDLAAEVLEQGLARTAAGGDIAHEGEACALVARALFATGAEDAAAARLAEVPDGARGNAFVALERARQALEHDELDQALAWTAPADGGVTPLHAEHPEAWRVRGLAFARLGRDADAQRLLLGFVERAPTDAEAGAAHALLERLARAQGDDERAARHGRAAQELGNYWAYRIARMRQLRADPDALLPALGLARQRLAVADAAGARDDLVDLVARHPDACEAWATLGDAERRLGNAAGARSAWTRALDCDASLAGVRYNRAQLAILEGRYDDAFADLDTLVASGAADQGPFVHAHVELARLLRAAGRDDDAALRYARYRELGGDEALVPAERR